MNNNVEHRSLARRGVPSIWISNCAPVIPVDPAPDAATALMLEHLNKIAAVNPPRTQGNG
jgi:hypothetical protein